jgi:glycerol-3-phosphate dehydrogenase
LELLVDARDIAEEAGISFELFTYHRTCRRGELIEIQSLDDQGKTLSIAPAAIINATGAWLDHTLDELGVKSEKLIGGTKGSHFVTFRRQLVELLGGDGVYVEAADGRPVFILPLGDAVLVGTTDEPFTGDPDTARATAVELRYLMGAVQSVFPQVTLTETDIELAYSGVRPLPATGRATPAAISRRHWLHEHADCTPPFYSIVGGKLTTCRSLAESAAKTILERLGREPTASSGERRLPGADYEDAVRLGVSPTMPKPAGGSVGEMLDATRYPVALARHMVEREWVRRLDDFVERRLMLLYHRPLTRRCLRQLADVLVEAGLLNPKRSDEEIAATIERLRERFRKRVE